jgi:hypothetical protein
MNLPLLFEQLLFGSIQPSKTMLKPAQTIKSALSPSEMSDLETKLRSVRSLDYWPSQKFSWNGVEEFLNSPALKSGIHSIYLENQILDIFVDFQPDSPAYILFHGNCPRAPNFLLPVFSGQNVTESMRMTKVVPCDPTLLLDPNIELCWHAGSSGVPLQTIYKKVFDKVFSIAKPTYKVFWGGSGGGFAALYYSYFFTGSTALVWNPQISISAYLEEPLRRYRQIAFGLTDDGAMFGNAELVADVSVLYRKGYSNRVVYIQNDDDWHVEKHLWPFLRALGVRDLDKIAVDGADGVVAPDVYLYLGRFSKNHEPPTNTEIHSILQWIHAGKGATGDFGFGALRRAKHTAKRLPDRLIAAIASSRITYFRSDWPHPSSEPVIAASAPRSMKFTTGLVIEAGEDGSVDWNIEFSSNKSDNIHELHSLFHVGRLLSLFEDHRDETVFQLALGIVRSFLTFIRDESHLKQVMKNRGFGSFDHSMSIRANVLVMLLQVVSKSERNLNVEDSLIGEIVAHLWDIGDVICDPEHLYPSNHGIIVSLTGLQIANQFKNLPYISRQFQQASNANLLGLIEKLFDKDGWANENTVGYHSFILRLLRDFVEYSRKNALESPELARIEEILERGTNALAFCVWQDGSIPPIGDSPLYRSGYSSINRSKFFNESGFLIIKDDRTYASLICGSRSNNHKQVDDSSITLHYDGEDFIVDGGSYCYDGQNLHRKYLESFRGHSGIFPNTYSAQSPREYLKNRLFASIEHFREIPGGSVAIARYRLKGGIECERRLFVGWDGVLIVVDEVLSENPDEIFTQTFLIGPHLRPAGNTRNAICFESDRYCLAVIHHSPSDTSCVTGVTDPEYWGWCSVDWRQILPTNQVRFAQKGTRASFLTEIRILRKGDANRVIDTDAQPSSDILLELKKL